MRDLKAQAIAAIEESAAELVEVSRRIHANPELSFAEHGAVDLLCGVLERCGLSPQRAAYGLDTSFRCEIGDQGPTVAILSEYDALPGLGHACGHNLIAAMGLGAAVGLSRTVGLPGRVRYLGAPAEEEGAGKALMVAQGAFDGVEAAMMVHPAGANLEEMPSLAVTGVSARFSGVASHAASAPEAGVNALDACVSAYQSIAQLRQHLTADEKVHGIITHGGTAPNVIPERAEAVYLLRARDVTRLTGLASRVEACLSAGALSAGATVSLTWWKHRYHELRSNGPLARAYRQNAEALGRSFVELAEVPLGVRGSTDMGNVSQVVPSIHPTIDIGSASTPPHSAGFADCAASASAEQALLDGAKAMAMTAIDLLCQQELRTAVRQEFAREEADEEVSP
ncbi:M20 family metallopeptidase [Nocardioides sp. LHD-245]|uniref:M20 family metallopeptidase n=1 Tax=Nocardioides sp. LHD-245 TaxID=3051387 RepID=UPI0027E20BE0|nr:M20 family metallopeptidase [Nocardioides sp. LHD-245]